MDNSASRSDPIRQEYFHGVEIAERASNWLFYVAALASLTAPFVDNRSHPVFYDWTQIFFVVAVISLFISSLFLRLYLTPRAEDKRRQDFFTSACNVSLTHNATVGYYNNDLTKPFQRIAGQVLENSHFGKAIALRMARQERTKIAIYTSLWLIAILNRSTDLGLVAAASQAVFSEQVLSKWLRLEWLRIRFEQAFDDVYRLFQSKPPSARFTAMALESLGMYETAKANAAITLSSSIFDKNNAELSAEWDVIKRELNI